MFGNSGGALIIYPLAMSSGLSPLGKIVNEKSAAQIGAVKTRVFTRHGGFNENELPRCLEGGTSLKFGTKTLKLEESNI